MADNALLGTPGVGDLQAVRRRLELPELVHYIDSHESPFFTFASKAVRKRKSSDDYKFLIHEARPIADKCEALATVSWAGGEATLQPTIDGTNADVSFLYPHASIKVTSPAAIGASAFTMRVKSVDTVAKTITCVGVSANVYTITDGDKMMVMAPSYPDGSGRGSVIWKDTENDYNYTQIMRLPAEVTYRLLTTRLHGPMALAKQKRDLIRLWKRYVERQYILGERAEDTDDGYTRSYTEGFITWLRRVGEDNTDVPITDKATYVDDYTYDELVGDMNTLFKFKSAGTKWAFCSRALIAHFSKIVFTQSTGRWNFDARKNKFGIVTWVLETPFGTLKLVQTDALEDDHDFTMLVVDQQGLRERYLKGWDTKWMPLDQNGVALTGDELYADLGLEMWAPETHGIVTWAGQTAP